MWHAVPARGAWVVEFRSVGAANWRQAGQVTSTPVAAQNVPAHEVYQSVLAPLRPGIAVEYRVGLNGGILFTAQAAVRAPTRQPFRCVVMGDVGAGSPEQKRVAFQVHQVRPEFVLVPGDFVYNNGRISEYRASFFPAYTAVAAAPESGAPRLSSCCFLGGRGQHDAEVSLATHSDGHGFFVYWSFPLNGPTLDADSRHVYPIAGTSDQQAVFRKIAGPRFPRMGPYSFDWGNAHWVVLETWNPHIDWTDPALRDWLRADLAAARDATWKIVSSYLPPFNSSVRYPQGQKMRVIVDLLEAAGVDRVFSGYAHSYQRTYPLRFRADAPPAGPVADPGQLVPGTFVLDKRYDGRAQTRPDGIIYVVSGCGGNPQLHSPEQTDNPQTWQPFTLRYNASLHQFTQLDCDGPRATVMPISLDGRELDQFVVSKRE